MKALGAPEVSTDRLEVAAGFKARQAILICAGAFLGVKVIVPGAGQGPPSSVTAPFHRHQSLSFTSPPPPQPLSISADAQSQ